MQTPPGLPEIDPRTGILPPICPTDGNSGFPVNITGPDITDTLLDTIKMPTSYKYSFAPRSTVPAKIADSGYLDEPTGSSFSVDGIQYDLTNVQLVPPPSTLSANYRYEKLKAGRPIAEYLLQYKKRNASDIGEAALIIIFPIYNVANSEGTQVIARPVQDYLSMHLGLQTEGKPYTPEVFMTSLPDSPRSISYTTCIETSSGNLSIKVILFLNGYCVSVELAKAYADYLKALENQTPTVIPTYRIAPSLRGGADTFRKIMTSDGKLVVADQNSEGYIRSTDIGTNTQEFKQRMMSSTEKPTSVGAKASVSRANRTLQNFKCIPLDQAKDIKGNYVLVDPATGERTLDQELDNQNKEVNLFKQTSTPPTGGSTNTMTTAFIIFGSVLGIAIIIYLLRLLWNYASQMGWINLAKAADVAVANAAAAAAVPPGTPI